MKKKILILIAVLVVILASYYMVQFYQMSKGVKEDSKRMENFEIPDKFQLNDSVTVITDTTLEN